MRSNVELVRFPLVIDPATQFLEVLLRSHVSNGSINTTKTFWSVLDRLPHRWNYPLPLDNRTPHLFGNSARLSRCSFLLGYSALGNLAAIYQRQGGYWVPHDLSEEHTGEIVRASSIRITFGSDDERQDFVVLLRTLADGEESATTLPDKAPTLLRAALQNLRLLPIAKPSPADMDSRIDD